MTSRRPGEPERSEAPPAPRARWDAHWSGLGSGSALFGRLSSFVRRQCLSRAVAVYAKRHLSSGGVVVEAGCGSAESSDRLDRGTMVLAGLDFSAAALLRARRNPAFRGFVLGDLGRLPFREGALGGLFNLGVMEHFAPEDGIALLREIRRALRPGSCAVLFWPPQFGSSRLVLAPVELVLSVLRGRPFQFFPDEPNRLRSRAHARRMLAGAGLEPVALDVTFRDAFIHLVVVARKPVS
jgi:SAM-dependent methyltransferase